MTQKQATKRINTLRDQCLIARYCYYVLAESLIDDYIYDMRERELKKLIEDYPEADNKSDNYTFCPTRTVGSSNADDYPRRIEQIAISLVKHKGDHGKF